MGKKRKDIVDEGIRDAPRGRRRQLLALGCSLFLETVVQQCGAGAAVAVVSRDARLGDVGFHIRHIVSPVATVNASKKKAMKNLSWRGGETKETEAFHFVVIMLLVLHVQPSKWRKSREKENHSFLPYRHRRNGRHSRRM